MTVTGAQAAVTYGEEVTLTANVPEGAAIQYQWYRDGEELSGAKMCIRDREWVL